jgi:type II secretory pathway component GspD/PulD (secretin)
MLRKLPSRGLCRGDRLTSPLRCAVLSLAALALTAFSLTAQAPAASPADSPASVPAGLLPEPAASAPKPPPPAPTPLSPKQLREADDAYLEGAKQIQHKNLAAAMQSFERAVTLDPTNRDYALALIVAREGRVTELVQSAAKARLLGDTAKADALLQEAHALDPDNRIVDEHLPNSAPPPAKPPFRPGLLYSSVDPLKFPAADIASTLAGPVELAPSAGKRTIHLHGGTQTVLRSLYSQFGITTVFDPSVPNGPNIDLDMTNVTFADAASILNMSERTFAVAVQPKVALIARDTQEMRDSLMPQVEETIYLPGLTNDEMQELANLARNVFDVKEVTGSATGGYLLLRGEENVLKQVNAVYDDMLDGGSEVLFDVNLYELNKTATRNIGATLPSSFSAFDLVNSAENLINSNQSIINQAISSGLLTLTGNPAIDDLAELAILIAAGVSGASEFTALVGTLGNYDGLPLAGVTLAGTSFNALLNSTDVRTLDAVQIRSSNKTPVNFRAGSRYPVITGSYSSGISSSLASSLSGLNINGTSASSLLSKYLGGASQVTVPQFQFEDLGITLKITPQILHNTEVTVLLDMKIEALAGASINNIPILNNRALTSTITIPAGRSAMIATLVNNTELKALTGVPGLNDLPGFQGTEQDREKDSDELLITITPHIVRSGRLNIASRRLASGRAGSMSSVQ